LFEFVKDGPLSQKSIFIIFTRLVSAISYLHSQSISHLDIKFENILITPCLQVKLLDFGSSFKGDSYLEYKDYKGSTGFAPPEIVPGNTFDASKVDMWALGVLLYRLSIDFYECSNYSLKHVDDSSLCDLLNGLLEYDAQERWNISQVLECEWFNRFE
jgi:serine/threonine protein kinase